MADAFGDVEIAIRLDDDGALTLPNIPTYGSSRHVANSTIDVQQYTGTGAATFNFDLVLERDSYDALIDIYRAIPRVAHTLMIGDDDYGQWFLDSITGARSLLTGQVFASAVFREAP
jgi:hypothetical protein